MLPAEDVPVVPWWIFFALGTFAGLVLAAARRDEDCGCADKAKQRGKVVPIPVRIVRDDETPAGAS